jgi:hypothetical protein
MPRCIFFDGPAELGRIRWEGSGGVKGVVAVYNTASIP